MELLRDPDIIEGYLRDASNTRGRAEALLRPRDSAEVAEIVAHCQATGTPLTVSAQRSSTTAASVPEGGWVMNLERLSAIEGPDVAQAGVILGQLQARLESAGRLFPPDPTSRHECSLGAAIACNASGARSFRYGPTRPWISWAEVVLPDGQIVHANRQTPLPEGWPRPAWALPGVKTAAGYHPADNLLDLIIGAEGTLGVITKAGLLTCPSPPAVLSMVAFFVEGEAMLAFVQRARAGATRARRPLAEAGDLNPRAIEYFDVHALDMIRARVPDIPAEARHALLIEVEHGGEPPLEAWVEALMAEGALVEATIVAEDEAGLARLHALRHAVPAGVNEQVVRNGMPKIGTDFAVPDEALPEMMAAYEAVELPHINFGHIGDNHLHLNLLPRDPVELASARALYKELAHKAISLGGTVSAEHGIGKLKRALLADMLGPQALAAQLALKRAADPRMVLCPGNMWASEAR